MAWVVANWKMLEDEIGLRCEMGTRNAVLYDVRGELAVPRFSLRDEYAEYAKAKLKRNNNQTC